jgi:hypothetical protein
VALSVVLAIATGVVGLSYVKAATADLGLDARGVVTSVMYLPSDASSSVRHSRRDLAAGPSASSGLPQT